MSHVIHKYPFTIQDTFYKMMPVNAKILKIDCQKGIPMMWVLHSINAEINEARYFRVYGTGHEITNIERLTHIGTFQMHNGDLVWHVFEEVENSNLYIEDVLRQTSKQPTESENV